VEEDLAREVERMTRVAKLRAAATAGATRTAGLESGRLQFFLAAHDAGRADQDTARLRRNGGRRKP
jgi:hypothetical protein